VYRAQDTRLSREVAIKVLPAGVAGDAERLKRFEKEARSASSLKHPNIVTIHDIGVSGGTSYIAMEMVDGETLRHAPRGRPADEGAARDAAQAAEGLAKAHGAGIVHQDLKPENLMVTQDGFVKILDGMDGSSSRFPHARRVDGARPRRNGRAGSLLAPAKFTRP